MLSAQGQGAREISHWLGWPASNREVCRHSCRAGRGCDTRAGPALEGPPARPSARPAVSQAWSQQQIANRLRLDFPEDVTMRVSREATYQVLHIPSIRAPEQPR